MTAEPENKNRTAPAKVNWPYADIVNLPHHVSSKHPQMEMSKRAAQFAPFAALTGYGDAVAETARLTDERIEIDESLLESLDLTLQQALAEESKVRLTYFVPDDKKAGGRYESITDCIKRTDMSEIILAGGSRIPVRHVIGLEIL